MPPAQWWTRPGRRSGHTVKDDVVMADAAWVWTSEAPLVTPYCHTLTSITSAQAHCWPCRGLHFPPRRRQTRHDCALLGDFSFSDNSTRDCVTIAEHAHRGTISIRLPTSCALYSAKSKMVGGGAGDSRRSFWERVTTSGRARWTLFCVFSYPRHTPCSPLCGSVEASTGRYYIMHARTCHRDGSGNGSGSGSMCCTALCVPVA